MQVLDGLLLRSHQPLDNISYRKNAHHGFALDYRQEFRNLPYIGILKPSVYDSESESPQTEHRSPLEQSYG